MVDEGRRRTLKQISTSVGVLAIAGCSGSGENEEAGSETTEKPNKTPGSTSEGASQTTPDDTEAPGNTETEQQTVSGYGTEMFSWLPDTRSEDEMGFISYSRPSDIAKSVGDTVASQYRENGYFVPIWADISLSDMPEAINSRYETIRMIDRDISSQLEERFETVGEEYGFTIYRGQAENDRGGDNDVVVAYDGEKAVSEAVFDLPENYVQNYLLPVLARLNEEGTPFIQNRPAEAAVEQVGFDDALRVIFGRDPEEGEILMQAIDFTSDGYSVSVYGATQDGEVVETTGLAIDGHSETFELGEYPGTLL
ncbi:hypothetical protein [Halapricum desulfuricans]|uniref:Uncharacterized protein n=1 Tax=Halapricum desulfuricans TaxID=2841257 RepID=A0A897N970_9EURY|nr:hypothetical protein [Halapricum desulfuricans]QSG08971.1 hypothetical protein HSR122_1580 [Halapricum desulfuricans]